MSSRICHLATPAEWEAAQTSGVVTSTYESEGFVHCSTPAQAVATIERHFAGVDELLVLVLDPVALGDRLRWEESLPGEVFPHLYRPIDVREVREVLAWRRSPDGSVALPSGLEGDEVT